MPSVLNPYINFDGNARGAMEFYQSVLGGKLNMTTFKEGQMSQVPSDDNRIMHGQLDTNNGMTLMGSDIMTGTEFTPGTNFTISLSGDNEAELRGYWDKLAKGATITQPLEQAPWGDTFGMLDDKFGISWMVNIAGKRS
jgi:PhnB protein